MLRKIISVFFLSIAGCMLYALGCFFFYFILNHTFPQQPNPLIYYVTFILISIFLGLTFWGFKRWRIALGMVLSIIGSMLLIIFITIPFLLISAQWKLIEKPHHPEMMKWIVVSAALFSIILLPIGVVLCIRQKKLDKAL